MNNKANTKNMNQAAKRELKPRLRFPRFAGPWEEKELSPYLKEHSERVSANTDLPIYSSTRSGLKPQKDYYDGRELVNDGEYGVVPDGFFVYRHMSDDGTFKFNINKTGERIAVSKEYPVFTTIDLHPDFLLHIINDGGDFKQFALMQKKGGTRTRLYFNTLCSWKTLLPSYPEQQKIADCLSSIDELITAEAQKLDALKDHKKGLMQRLFPAEGETLPKLRFPEFLDAGEWGDIPFGNLIKINSGKGFKAAEYSNTGIRLLQIENVSYGVVKWNENSVYLPQSYTLEHPELVLREGDIVLALNRPVTNNELKIARLQKRDDPSILYQRVGKLELISESIINDFAFQMCQGFVKDFVVKQAIGSDQPFISLRELYAKKITIPSPSEQQKIADCLSSIDELITAEAQKLDTLKRHKKGLMQQLFPALDEVQG